MGKSNFNYRRWLLAAALLFLMTTACQLSAQTRSFDVEEGSASANLREFARQARVSVVMDRQNVEGVRTNEVSGLLIPKYALDRMLEGTPLVFKEDLETGAFAVTRSKESIAELTTQGSEVQTPESEQKPKKPTPMNENKKTISGFFKGLLALALTSSPSTFSQDDTSNDKEIFELSPFVVSPGEGDGYRATTTLAGTRLKTDLVDVGAAVSVVTEEFLDDTGLTDLNELLPYAMNTEAGGVFGNYSSATVNGGEGFVNQDGLRKKPQGSQRVRGLAEASLTRNFFLTDIPMDSYNTSSVTINRGPNSLLFGIGSPGGVIESSLKTAALGSNFGEFSIRLGERGTHRETFDYNSDIIPGRLAIRGMGLYETTEFQQKPAYETDERLYASLTALLFENTESSVLGSTFLRASFERGNVTSSPPAPIGPIDSFSSWWEPADHDLFNYGSPAFYVDEFFEPGFVPQFTVDNIETQPNQIWAVNDPRLRTSAQPLWYHSVSAVFSEPGGGAYLGLPNEQNIGGLMARMNFQQADTGPYASYGRFDLMHTFDLRGRFPGFTMQNVMNSDVFNNEDVLFYGDLQQNEQDFETQSLAFEQLFFEGNGGIELAYDSQSWENLAKFPFGAQERDSYSVSIDISERLGDGSVNPNLGRPFILSHGTPRTVSETDREAFRATVFYKHDLTESDGFTSWLGRHTFTGFYNDQNIDQLHRHYRTYWEGVDGDITSAMGSNVTSHTRRAYLAAYVGPSMLDVGSAEGVRLNAIDIDLPEVGDIITAKYWDGSTGLIETSDLRMSEFLSNGSGFSGQKIETHGFSWMGEFFSDNLIAILGWRSDESNSFEGVDDVLLADRSFDPANLVPSTESVLSAEGNTFTGSVVGHFPENRFFELPKGTDLSVHYMESENFEPSSLRRNLLGELIESPVGETKEYGFTFSMNEGKVAARFNWFETSSVNSTFRASIGNIINGLTFKLRDFAAAERAGMSIQETMSVVAPPDKQNFWTSYDQAYTDIINLLPAQAQDVWGLRVDGGGALTNPVQGLSSTSAFVAEGFEFEVVGQITDGWSVSMNIAQQETVQTNVLPVAVELGNEILNNIENSGFADFYDTPTFGPILTFRDRYSIDSLSPIVAAKTKEGQKSQEQSEWRANAILKYAFLEGRLRGVSVGGAARWQDSAAIGYPFFLNEQNIPVPDIANPIVGENQFNGDLWLSYEKRLFDRLDWKMQVNVRNAFGDSDPIPVFANPNGEVAIFRNPNPREWYLTNTFSF